MINYYDYIQSEEWQKLTEPIRLRNGELCECCCLRWSTEVHHRTYARLGKELDTDLIALCHHCHSVVHGLEPLEFIWPERLSILNKLIAEAKLLTKDQPANKPITNGEIPW